MSNDFYFTNEEIDDIASDCFMVLDEVNDPFDDEEEDGEVRSEEGDAFNEDQKIEDPSDIKLSCTKTPDTETVDLTEEEENETQSQNEREHPYLNIVESYKVTKKQMRMEELETPQDPSSTPLHVIDSVMHLMKLIKTLKKEEEIAIHMQNYMECYENVICLLQLSTKDADYLIDAIKLKGELLLLTEIFTDPKILKIVYDGETTLSLLQQCLHLFLINIFNIEKAIEIVVGKKPPPSPNAIIAAIYGRKCHTHRTKDFRQRPLPDTLKNFARFPPHFLIHLYHHYKNELLKKPENVYTNFLKYCRDMCKIVYPERKVLLLQKMKEELNSFQKCQCEILERLYEWRDETAKRLNKNANSILPKSLTLRLAVQLAVNPKEAEACVASPYVKCDAQKITQMAYEMKEKYKIQQRVRVKKCDYANNPTAELEKRKLEAQPNPNSNKQKNIQNKPVNNTQTQPVNKKIKYDLRTTAPFLTITQSSLTPIAIQAAASQAFWQPTLPTANPAVAAASPEMQNLLKLSQIISSSLISPAITNKILNPTNVPSKNAFQNKAQFGNAVVRPATPPAPPPPIIPPQLLDRVGVNNGRLNSLNCDTQDLNRYLSTLTNEKKDSRSKSRFSPIEEGSARYDPYSSSLDAIDERIESLEREFRPRDPSNSRFRSKTRWSKEDSPDENVSWKRY